jgi:hypothetical protein
LKEARIPNTSDSGGGTTFAVKWPRGRQGRLSRKIVLRSEKLSDHSYEYDEIGLSGGAEFVTEAFEELVVTAPPPGQTI